MFKEEETGELLHSIAHRGRWEQVEDRKSCYVWVMRSKAKFLVREGVLKPEYRQKWKGRKLSKGGGCYAQSADSLLQEEEVKWERKPEYAHMYYRGKMAGNRDKEASCLLEEARIFKMPLPISKYNSEAWEFVRCRLVEEAVETPVERISEVFSKYKRDTWI